MANNLGIEERTLAQMATASDTINLVGPTHPRKSAYQPLVVRATNHVDDDNAEEDDAEKMAIFVSRRVGEPWEKQHNVLSKIIHVGPTTVPTNVAVLFPNYDYTGDFT